MKADVLIIGGSAAGMVAAVTGKFQWPDKKIHSGKKTKRCNGALWYSLHFRNT